MYRESLFLLEHQFVAADVPTMDGAWEGSYGPFYFSHNGNADQKLPIYK